MFKTQINPTTGKMETIGGPSSPLPVIPLAGLRKETRDVIEGNVQFHTDPEWGDGVWECRPSCNADLPQETNLLLAIEGDDEPKESHDV